MSGDVHVRFCEKLRVKLPRLTRRVAESFFHSLKVELIGNYSYQSREEAKQSIFHYIEVYYNRIRRHSTIGSIAPMIFENQCKAVA